MPGQNTRPNRIPKKHPQIRKNGRIHEYNPISEGRRRKMSDREMRDEIEKFMKQMITYEEASLKILRLFKQQYE